MNRWKWFSILLAIVSISIVAAASFFAWPGWGLRVLPRRDLQGLPVERTILTLDQHIGIVSSISVFVSLAIVGILILFIIPRRIRFVARKFPASSVRLLRLMLLGFLVLILVLVASLISVLPIGTFPLAILMSGALFVAGLIGFIALAYAFGRGLMKRAGWQHLSPLYAYLLGLLVLLASTRIPWIGPVFFLAIASLGLGATIEANFGSGQPWNLNPLVEEEKDEQHVE